MWMVLLAVDEPVWLMQSSIGPSICRSSHSDEHMRPIILKYSSDARYTCLYTVGLDVQGGPKKRTPDLLSL